MQTEARSLSVKPESAVMTLLSSAWLCHPGAVEDLRASNLILRDHLDQEQRLPGMDGTCWPVPDALCHVAAYFQGGIADSMQKWQRLLLVAPTLQCLAVVFVKALIAARGLVPDDLASLQSLIACPGCKVSLVRDDVGMQLSQQDTSQAGMSISQPRLCLYLPIGWLIIAMLSLVADFQQLVFQLQYAIWCAGDKVGTRCKVGLRL